MSIPAPPLRRRALVGTLESMRRTVIVTAAVLLAAAPAGASSSERYADPLGDARLAPDVGAVVAANDDDGRLSWRVSVANRTLLRQGDVYVLWLDTDLNVGSGQGGADFAVIVDGGDRTAALARFDGGRWRFGTQRSLSVRWRRGLEIAFARELVASPEQLDFAVAASAGGETDWAPDERPHWRYQPIVSPSPGA